MKKAPFFKCHSAGQFFIPAAGNLATQQAPNQQLSHPHARACFSSRRASRVGHPVRHPAGNAGSSSTGSGSSPKLH
eukprot:668476-Rhodomonas_salina.1